MVARGDYVAACSTAFRSATEENDSGGHVDGTYPTKVAQPNSAADWLRILVTSPDQLRRNTYGTNIHFQSQALFLIVKLLKLLKTR